MTDAGPREEGRRGGRRFERSLAPPAHTARQAAPPWAGPSSQDERARALSHAHREALERGDRRGTFGLFDVRTIVVGFEQP